jgi:hypothetical protein
LCAQRETVFLLNEEEKADSSQSEKLVTAQKLVLHVRAESEYKFTSHK